MLGGVPGRGKEDRGMLGGYPGGGRKTPGCSADSRAHLRGSEVRGPWPASRPCPSNFQPTTHL